MTDVDSLGTRYKDKITAIRQYLADELPDKPIRQSEDFDRDGIVLRTGAGSKSGYRVFISHELLSDYSGAAILSQLRSWRTTEAIKQLPLGFTLFLTTEGAFQEQTQGRSLKEATEAFEGLLPLSQRRKELYERVFAIRVDGMPLGDTSTEFQGDSELYVTYSDDFANALGAVYLLDAAGYRNFALHRTPELRESGIDFRISLPTGAEPYLVFRRAINPAERRANALREQVNVRLRRVMRDDPTVGRALDGRFIQITLPRAPDNERGVNEVVAQILSFVERTDWSTLTNNSFVAFEELEYPLLAELGAQVYMAAQGPAYLSVVEGASVMDPYAPYKNAALIIARESHRSFDVEPVWLGISIADVIAFLPLSESFESQFFASLDVESTPFDHIIVGSAEKARDFRRMLSPTT
jgi:hypothetical protein